MFRNPHSLPLPPVTPHPVPPVIPPAPPKPVTRFQSSSYSGIEAAPYDPLSAARPVEPPFAPGAFMRPGPPPMPVTHLPAGLAGPIYGGKGWHFGPPVHAAVRSGYNTSKIDWVAVAEAKAKKKSCGCRSQSEYAGSQQVSLGIGLSVGVLLLLGLPIASSITFGRKYGGPGYIWGFFVPGAIGAGIAALGGMGKNS